MSRPRRLSAFALAATIASSAVVSPAFAQSETGTGGGPGSTITAPHTSSVGQTMPPSRGAGAATADDRQVRTPNEKKDDQLMRGICIGCNAR